MAALPQAGVSLEAKNFDKYIKQLKVVETRQKTVFGTKYTKTTESFVAVSRSAKNYDNQMKNVSKSNKLLAASMTGLATGGVLILADAFIKLSTVAVSSIGEVISSGIKLNQQFQQTSTVLGNVFKDADLGRAATEEIAKAASAFRVDQGAAAAFAQNILPRTGSLDTFLELLRLTDIQSDTTGKSLNELEFSIREALSGDFVSLKDQFDIGNDVVNRIKELTPVLGADAALAKVLGDEFARLGKVNLEGTLTTQVKDLQSRFSEFSKIVGEPVFAELQNQLSNILDIIDQQGPGVERLAISFGEVVASVTEFIGTNLADFISTINFDAINQGVDVVFALTEAFKTLFDIFRTVQGTGATDVLSGLLSGNVIQLTQGLTQLSQSNFEDTFAKINAEIKEGVSNFEAYTQRVEDRTNAEKGATDAQREAINAYLSSSNEIKRSAESLSAYTKALEQAESIQLSFARSAEDSARKLARSQSKLATTQARELDKLFIDQQKSLDDFESDRIDKIKKAERDIVSEQSNAGKNRLKEQQKLHKQLRQQQDRFNLSRLQSERRFRLDETRLLAEGDILGIQQLREDFALQQQENKENFDLQQKESKSSGQDRIREEQAQTKQRQEELQSRLNDLKQNLENERVELLASFDTQEQELRAKQLQQRQDLLTSYAEQQEDARINQQRQLEDLGRNLARQKDVTGEGVSAIAGEIEKVFGQEGVADTIFSGFTTRTESEFTELLANVEQIVTKSNKKLAELKIPELLRSRTDSNLPIRLPGFNNTPSSNLPIHLPGFDDGGVVPGPRGSSQIIQAHGGETVLPTHKINNPVIPAQTLNVVMDGGFDIRGGEAAGSAATEAAIGDMVEMMKIAVDRISRQ